MIMRQHFTDEVVPAVGHVLHAGLQELLGLDTLVALIRWQHLPLDLADQLVDG